MLPATDVVISLLVVGLKSPLAVNAIPKENVFTIAVADELKIFRVTAPMVKSLPNHTIEHQRKVLLGVSNLDLLPNLH